MIFVHAVEAEQFERSKLTDNFFDKIEAPILSQVTYNAIILQEFKRNNFAIALFCINLVGNLLNVIGNHRISARKL